MALLPRSVVLFRHGQKTGHPGDRGLSPLGRSRALALAMHWPATLAEPDVLIACTSTHKSTRPVDTLRPLAARLSLAIDTRWGTQDYADLASHLSADERLRDRCVLICWRHDTLPQLAESLGAPAPALWPETLYDVFWVIETHDGRVGLNGQSFRPPRDAATETLTSDPGTS